MKSTIMNGSQGVSSKEELQPLNYIAEMGQDKVRPEAEGRTPNGNTHADERDDGCCPLAGSLRRYPGSVWFMFGNEFCERFSFYGMRAILTLYFIVEHGFDDSKASLFFHLFVAICYFSPLLGSILSDGYFGRFKVILWGSAIYVGGHALLTMGSIPGISTALRDFFDFSGLFVIGMATGTIKPCVAAFAADQFPPEMKKEREQFFSFFYFAINAGSFLAIIITPLLRGRVKCLGSEYCFPLAFGVPAVLMAVALFLFILGWKHYKKETVKGNIIGEVFQCTTYAIRERMSNKRKDGGKEDHWLDYAMPKYPLHLVEAIKSMCSILIMFIPVVFFWALFDQQGSTWVLQARRMSGRIGNLTILPDHTNVFNPLFIMALIPVFESFIYPMAQKITRVTALRKMALGGLLAALSFVIAGFVQIEVNKSLVSLPTHGDVSLFAFNANPGGKCPDLTIVGHSDHNSRKNLNVDEVADDNWKFETSFSRNITFESSDTSCVLANQKLYMNSSIHSEDGYAIAAFVGESGLNYYRTMNFELEKTPKGSSRIYILSSQNHAAIRNDSIGHIISVRDDHNAEVGFAWLDNTNNTQINVHIDITPDIISSGLYKLVLRERCSKSSNGIHCTNNRTLMENYASKTGAADVLVLWQGPGENKPWSSKLHQVIPENRVNILWQIPQFFVMTVAEILFSISGLEFSYSQAAPSMRSVLQALWLLTVAFGNVIDIAISGSHVIKEPALEFFFYAGLMSAVMIVFIVLANRYKYVDTDKWDEIEDYPNKDIALTPTNSTAHFINHTNKLE